MSDTPPSDKRTPLWRSIADGVRGDIREGRYVPGDKLPTEASLAERFGVNRHTVRHALAQLVTEGLVRTRRGAGAFVAAKPTEYAIGKRVRFHENLIAGGQHPEKRILTVERRAATAEEARALALEPGQEVCAYHGISLADGQPIALVESVFPITRLPGIDVALRAHSGITQALAQAGVSDFTRKKTRLNAVLATATQALHLHVAEGDPVLHSTGINVDGAGTPVEYGLTWFAGDRVTLTLDT